MQLARFLNKLFKTGGFVLIDFNLKKYNFLNSFLKNLLFSSFEIRADGFYLYKF